MGKIVSRIKIDFELEIQGLSSPQIVRIMKEAKEHPNKVYKVNDFVFVYRRNGNWQILKE